METLKIGRKFTTLIAVGVIGVFCWGCRHTARRGRSEDDRPAGSAHAPTPRIMVLTNRAQPIQYQPVVTNDSQGNRVFRFVPGSSRQP